MGTVIKYVHKYGDGKEAEVFVQRHLIGMHKHHCLCFQGCKSFKPGQPDNCPIAQANYEFCVEHDLVLPVWECPVFKVGGEVLA